MSTEVPGPVDARRDTFLPILHKGAFAADLPAALNRARQAQEPLALIMVDLDRFKATNDTHGHLVGDEVLLEVARCLNRRVGAKGFVYRYGGEEIAVILPNYCAKEALALAERLRKDVGDEPMSSRGLTVTASFGIACFPQHGESSEELVQGADASPALGFRWTPHWGA